MSACIYGFAGSDESHSSRLRAALRAYLPRCLVWAAALVGLLGIDPNGSTAARLLLFPLQFSFYALVAAFPALFASLVLGLLLRRQPGTGLLHLWRLAAALPLAAATLGVLVGLIRYFDPRFLWPYPDSSSVSALISAVPRPAVDRHAVEVAGNYTIVALGTIWLAWVTYGYLALRSRGRERSAHLEGLLGDRSGAVMVVGYPGGGARCDDDQVQFEIILISPVSGKVMTVTQ